MKHIRWIALALLIGVVAVGGVWASLNLNDSTETTSTDTPGTDNQTADNSTLGATASSSTTTDVPPANNNTSEAANPPSNNAETSQANSGNQSTTSSGNKDDEIPVAIGRGSWATDKDVPAFLVMKTVFEEWLEEKDREEYDLFEIDIYVNDDLTRYLAVGPLFLKDAEKIPVQLKPQLNPWVKAKYTGDFGEYRMYELE